MRQISSCRTWRSSQFARSAESEWGIMRVSFRHARVRWMKSQCSVKLATRYNQAELIKHCVISACRRAYQSFKGKK